MFCCVLTVYLSFARFLSLFYIFSLSFPFYSSLSLSPFYLSFCARSLFSSPFSLFIPLYLYLCLLFISLSVPVLFSLSNNHAHTLSRSLSLFLSLSFGYFFYPCLLDDFSLSLIPMLFLTIDKLF